VSWLERRTTGDLLILIISLTVCGTVLLGMLVLGTIAVIQPGTDTTAGAAAIVGVINVLIGLLAGFLAGRTDTHLSISRDRVEADRRAVPENDADG
jgi:hypothetical protein